MNESPKTSDEPKSGVPVGSSAWLGVIPETSEGVDRRLQDALFEEAAVGVKASTWLAALGKCPDAGHHVARIPGIGSWLKDTLRRWNLAGRPDLEWPQWVQEGAAAVCRRVCSQMNHSYVCDGVVLTPNDSSSATASKVRFERKGEP